MDLNQPLEWLFLKNWLDLQWQLFSPSKERFFFFAPSTGSKNTRSLNVEKHKKEKGEKTHIFRREFLLNLITIRMTKI